MTEKQTINLNQSNVLKFDWGSISQHAVRNVTHNLWDIPHPSYATDIYDAYYILHWQVSHFARKLQEYPGREGILLQNNKPYYIQYHRVSEKDILSSPRNTQLLLSFRDPKDFINCPPIVLVTLDRAPNYKKSYIQTTTKRSR